MKNPVEVLKRAGVEPVVIQGYTNNSQDFTSVALAVKQSGADVMSTYMTFSPIRVFLPGSCASWASILPGSVLPRRCRRRL